jgi:hypothetical protein
MVPDKVYFDQYDEYAKVLRNWLVVYGVSAIGALVLEKAFDKIDANHKQLIVLILLLGIGVQILVTLINKWVNWYRSFREPIVLLDKCITGINFLGDLLSLVLLFGATGLVVLYMW